MENGVFIIAYSFKIYIKTIHSILKPFKRINLRMDV